MELDLRLIGLLSSGDWINTSGTNPVVDGGLIVLSDIHVE